MLEAFVPFLDLSSVHDVIAKFLLNFLDGRNLSITKLFTRL